MFILNKNLIELKMLSNLFMKENKLDYKLSKIRVHLSLLILLGNLTI